MMSAMRLTISTPALDDESFFIEVLAAVSGDGERVAAVWPSPRDHAARPQRINIVPPRATC